MAVHHKPIIVPNLVSVLTALARALRVSVCHDVARHDLCQTYALRTTSVGLERIALGSESRNPLHAGICDCTVTVYVCLKKITA